jgi:hypothetical protein
MPILSFQYQKHHRDGFIPLCEFSLLGRKRRVTIRAVIDSGATHPFFLRSTADDAGIDLSKARPFHTTFGGSETIGLLTEAYVEFQQQRFRLEVVFVEDIRLGYALLGRHSFFSQFNEVAFIERIENKRVELRG